MRWLVLCAFLVPLLAVEEDWIDDRRVVLKQVAAQGFLAKDRDIVVHLPAGWREMEDIRVLYCFDGESALSRGKKDRDHQRGMGDLDLMHDQLVGEGLIHPTAFVAIPNAGVRGPDLNPTAERGMPGLDAGMHRFITEVLKPMLADRYGIATEPERVGILGFSYGGRAAAWLGYYHPDDYGMAACLSPSLWSARELMKDVAEQDGGPTGTRFYCSNGGMESRGRDEVIEEFLTGLEARGWQREVDISYALAYGQGHNEATYPARSRNMMLFLLGVDPIRITGTSIVAWDGRSPEVLRPCVHGEGARGLLQLDGEHDYYGHVYAAEWVSSDPSVVRFDPENPGMPIPVAAGEVAATASYNDWSASIPAAGCDPATLFEPIALPAVPTAVAIDGDLSEWGPLPHGTETLSFAIARNGEGVVMAVRIRDDDLRAGDDRIMVMLDATQGPLAGFSRAFQQRGGNDDTIVTVEVRTGKDGGSRDRSVRWVSLVAEDVGTLEVSIADDALQARAGDEPWELLRVNVVHDDRDRIDGYSRVQRAWQPRWEAADNVVGSGMFQR